MAWLSNRDGFTLQNKYSVMIQDIRLPVLAVALASMEKARHHHISIYRPSFSMGEGGADKFVPP